MAEIFLGYHKTHENGGFKGEKFFTNTKIPIGSTLFVVSGNKVKSADKITYYLEGKYKIVSTGENTDDRFKNKKNSYNLKHLISTKTAVNLNNEKNFDSETFHNYFTSNQSAKKITGNQTYLIKLFDDLLNADEKSYDLDLIDDLSSIDSNEADLSETEKLAMKLARIGQGEFRKNTIEAWGGDEKCAVTGLRIPALLNASHIIPWRECRSVEERKSGSNGLLLCVHLDRLFDRFLIGFQRTCKPDVRALVFSPKIKEKSLLLNEIGINNLMILDLTMVKFSAKPQLERNLDKHLDRVLNEE